MKCWMSTRINVRSVTDNLQFCISCRQAGDNTGKGAARPSEHIPVRSIGWCIFIETSLFSDNTIAVYIVTDIFSNDIVLLCYVVAVHRTNSDGSCITILSQLGLAGRKAVSCFSDTTNSAGENVLHQVLLISNTTITKQCPQNKTKLIYVMLKPLCGYT